jgi:hypothetical protein
MLRKVFTTNILVNRTAEQLVQDTGEYTARRKQESYRKVCRVLIHGNSFCGLGIVYSVLQ